MGLSGNEAADAVAKEIALPWNLTFERIQMEKCASVSSSCFVCLAKQTDVEGNQLQAVKRIVECRSPPADTPRPKCSSYGLGQVTVA